MMDNELLARSPVRSMTFDGCRLRAGGLNFAQPALQKSAFGIISDQRQRSLIVFRGFHRGTKTAQQIRARSMEQMIVREIVGCCQSIDQVEACLRALGHSHGHRAVEGNDGRGLNALQQIIKPDNLRPIGFLWPFCLAMNRRDCRLQGKWARSAAEGFANQRQSFRNLTMIPEASILLPENNDAASF